MQSPSQPLHILYVDDELPLLELGRAFLEQMENFRVETSSSARNALSLLGHTGFDAIVCDFQMPGMDGMEFLREVRTIHGDIPFILFTGRGREEIVIRAITSGADFYVQKGGEPRSQFADLAHKVKQAVRRRKAEQDLKYSEDRFSKVFHASPIQELILESKTRQIIDANESFLTGTGYSRQDVIGRTIDELGLAVKSREGISLTGILSQKHQISNVEVQVKIRSGEIRTVLISLRHITAAGHDLIVSQAIDITEQIETQRILRQKTSELMGAYEHLAAIEADMQENLKVLACQREALQSTRADERTLLDASLDYVCLYDRSGTIFAINERMAKEIKKPVMHLIGENFFDAHSSFSPDMIRSLSEHAFFTQKTVEKTIRLGDRTCEIRVVPVMDTNHPVNRVAFIARVL
ncbi:MAG: response regulator [Methanoregula sp.]|jgi:PAS domain S-box-containing protein